jgi:hypothetical protein
MRRNDFARAWQLTDDHLAALRASRRDKHSGERHHQRIWCGESLHQQHVLVRCYHGLGDTIQFARFLPLLRSMARSVSLWVQPPLQPLLASMNAVDCMLPLHDGTPDAVYDVDIEIMELAHALRADARMITPQGPYLSVDAGVLDPLEPTKRLSVGLVWDVGDWDKRRRVPPALLSSLAKISFVDLLSLQLGTSRGEAADIPARDIATTQIENLAHRLKQLDLVITVDTMVAHLAGALGVPCWTMLHADCDWRWPRDQATTIWYPSMRLFHQRDAGDWSGVVDEIAAALERLASDKAKKTIALATGS